MYRKHVKRKDSHGSNKQGMRPAGRELDMLVVKHLEYSTSKIPSLCLKNGDMNVLGERF